MKKVIAAAALALSLLFGCAGPQYHVGEGPLRMKLSTASRFVQVDKPFLINVIFAGDIKYLNGETYYVLTQHIKGWENEGRVSVATLARREAQIVTVVPRKVYLRQMGLEKITREEQFWSQGVNPNGNLSELPPIDGNEFDATAVLIFRLYYLEGVTTDNRAIVGAMIDEAKFPVEMLCYACEV